MMFQRCVAKNMYLWCFNSIFNIKEYKVSLKIGVFIFHFLFNWNKVSDLIVKIDNRLMGKRFGVLYVSKESLKTVTILYTALVVNFN